MKMQQLLKDASNWTQFELARSRDGAPVDSNDPHAVAWCLLGAVNRCYGVRTPEASKVLAKLYAVIGAHVADWNDHPLCTFDDVQFLIKTLDI